MSVEHIFSTNYNVVMNLGIKCDTLDIAKYANVRYFSSPFDNVDTVKGLTDSGKLMCNGFENYWDQSDWHIVRFKNRKKMYNYKYPTVAYPHMNAKWIKELSEEQIKNWECSSELSFEPIWTDFKNTFDRRQKRIISLLNSNNNILFLRVDVDTRKVRKNAKLNNNSNTINNFMKMMTHCYPKKNWGFLYFYYGAERKLQSDFGNCGLINIPNGKSRQRTGWVVEELNKLNILPREELECYEK